MEKSLQGHQSISVPKDAQISNLKELVSVEYLLKNYLKVIFSGLRNAKWPYLDLFCCLETFRHSRAVGIADNIFLTLDEGNQA
jgi:hypothetical protein